MNKIINWIKSIYSKLTRNKEVRILLFSDTHSQHSKLSIPENIDIALFAGDAGTYRNPVMNTNPVLDFIEWYASLPNIKHKVWIAGNHCTSIEYGLVDAKILSKEFGLVYLQHETCHIEGLEIFGSPYTPSFGVGWAFNVSRNKIRDYWEEIPETTDILITHGGVRKINKLSVVESGEDVGCIDLTDVVIGKLKKLVLMVSGHIHEAYGYHQETPDSPLFVNASVLNLDYKLVNKPFIVTMNLKTKKILSIETHG